MWRGEWRTSPREKDKVSLFLGLLIGKMPLHPTFQVGRCGNQDEEELLSDRARADTSAPGSSSWLSNMEFSSNSMTDNSFDKDNPLKQVLQLCSTLAGKGCDFSISVKIRDCFSFSLKSGKPQPQQAKKRSPSFYRRQERRRLLRKKNKDLSLEEPRETPQAKEKHRFT